MASEPNSGEKPKPDVFDRVIEDWERERPDLDTTPIGIVGRLRLAGRLVTSFYDRSVKPFDLRPADFFLLSELRRAGSPYTLSPGELSQELVRSSGGITRMLDHLEQRGWIRRAPDPNDRRGVRAVLTDEGLALIDEALIDHFDNEAELLEDLAPSDRERLADLLREVVGILVTKQESARGTARRKGSRRPGS